MQGSERTPLEKNVQELEAENKRLQEELNLEQLRNRALNVMIDIAEEQLKIPIRKKIWCQTVEEIAPAERNFGIDLLCGLFGKTRQAYYKSKKNHFKELVINDLIITLVMEVREKQRRIGARKLINIISSQMPDGMPIGRDAFFNLLSDHGLLVRRRKTRIITTNSFHWLHKYPNLIRDFIPVMPNQLWVSDITYIKTLKGFLCCTF